MHGASVRFPSLLTSHTTRELEILICGSPEQQLSIAIKKYTLAFLWLAWKIKKNYSTEYSRVVPHHSTDSARRSLTSEIGRDPVLSTLYGRNWISKLYFRYKLSFQTTPFINCYFSAHLLFTTTLSSIAFQNYFINDYFPKLLYLDRRAATLQSAWLVCSVYYSFTHPFFVRFNYILASTFISFSVFTYYQYLLIIQSFY